MDTQGVKPDSVDINKLVQEMKDQGLSKAQASGMITSVMGSVTQNFQDAPVASKRKSDTPVDASVPSDFNPGSELVARMNEAWGEEPAQETGQVVEAVPKQVARSPEQQRQTSLDFSSIGFDESMFSIQGVLGKDTIEIPYRSTESASEVATIFQEVVYAGDTDTFDPTREALEQGNDGVIDEQSSISEGAEREQDLKLAEEKIQAAETNEEVLAIVEELKASKDGFYDLGDYREEYIIKRLPNNPMLPRADAEIAFNQQLARNIDMQTARLFQESSWGEILGDLGELIIPFVGTGEVEFAKFKLGIGNALDKLDTLPKEQQITVLENLVEEWAGYETTLMGRNNSMLTSIQVDRLKRSILEGGIQMADGEVTDSQKGQFAETLFNLGFGVIGSIQTIKGLSKAIAAKMLPETITTTAHRDGSSVLDSLYDLEPKEFLKTLKKDPIAEAVRHGLTQEQASTRHIGGPSASNLPGFPNVREDLIEVNELLLIDESAVNMGMKRARVLETQTGTSLNVMDSATGFRSNTDNNSLGDFLFTMGDGNAGGFKTKQDALNAMESAVLPDGAKLVSKGELKERAAEELLSAPKGTAKKLTKKQRKQQKGMNAQTLRDSQTEGGTFVNPKNFAGPEVAEDLMAEGAEWFVEVPVKHIFSSKMDVLDLSAAGKKSYGRFSGMFLNPLRILGGEVLEGVFALNFKHKALAEGFDKKVQTAFSGMSPGVADIVGHALKLGDDTGKQYNTLREFSTAVGQADSSSNVESAFRKYAKIRAVMDDIYEARNKIYYSKKKEAGFFGVDVAVDGGIHKTAGRRVALRDLELDEVYDPKTKTMLKPKEDTIVVRLDDPIETPNGLYRHVVLQASDTGDLSLQALTKRTGHIDRMYRDSGWIVRSGQRAVIDGVEEVKTATTHIVKNEAQADAIVAQNKLDNPDYDGVASRSRENSDLDDIYSDSDSVQFSYGASHTMHRGEALRGADGLTAPTVGVFESMQSSIRQVEKIYNVQMLESLKSRFYNQFSGSFNEGMNTKFSDNFDNMLKSKDTLSKSEVAKARQWHDYISSLSHMEKTQLYTSVDSFVESLASRFGVNVEANTQGAAGHVLRAVAHAIITARPLYQIPQNLIQATYIAYKNPVGGMKAVGQLPLLMQNILGASDNYLVASKVLGVSDETAKMVIKDLRESGMLQGVGRADDFLSMTAGNVNVSQFKGTANRVGKVAGDVAMSPLRVSQALQENSIKVVNALAYLSEFNVEMAKKGSKFNAVTKQRISFNAQRLTATQNSIDKFTYQKAGNLLAFPLQFVQHMHKMLLDVVLDPSLSLAGKKLGNMPGAFSETKIKGATALIATLMIFGPEGLTGEKFGNSISNEMRRLFPEATKNPYIKGIIEGGLFNNMFNSVLGNFVPEGEVGRVDASTAVSPASMLDVINDLILGTPGSLDYFGASFGVASDAWKRIGIGGTAWIIASHDKMDTADKVQGFLWEVGGILKGVQDMDKAIVAYNMQVFPYTTTLSSNMRVSMGEGIATAMNMRPALMNDYFANANFSKSRKSEEAGERIVNVMLKQMSRELAEMQSKGELNMATSTLAHAKWVSHAKNSLDPSLYQLAEDTFSMKALTSQTPNYKSYIEPYIEKATLGDRANELRVLLNQAPTAEAQKEIEDALIFVDTMEKSLMKIHEIEK